jgi:uncharacterized protein (DUF433 family)
MSQMLENMGRFGADRLGFASEALVQVGQGHPACNALTWNGFDRIMHSPEVLGGRATIRGLRFSIAHVVNLIANGFTPQQTTNDLPDVDKGRLRLRVEGRVRADETIASSGRKLEELLMADTVAQTVPPRSPMKVGP